MVMPKKHADDKRKVRTLTATDAEWKIIVQAARADGDLPRRWIRRRLLEVAKRRPKKVNEAAEDDAEDISQLVSRLLARD